MSSPSTSALTLLKGSVGKETEDAALRLPRRWCLAQIESIRRHQAERLHRKEWHPEHDEEFWASLGQDVAEDATPKVAAALGVPPIAVALAARACWNGVWGLTGEREHRLAVRQPGIQRDHTDTRTLQALRAHITRALRAELRPLLQGITPKRRRRKR